MQSLRQYRALGAEVKAQVASGTITNSTSDKNSILDEDAHSTDSFSTAGLKDSSLDTISVGWSGPNDPLSPRNWSLSRRLTVFAILWINVFAVDWASSADSQANTTIAKAFHVSDEAEALSPSLYTFGIAIGALFAGPIAETVGRNPIYVVSRILNVVWLLGAALAPNFGAQCVFRLFAGLSASILLAIHAASIADIFGPLHRTIAWPSIALASFWGTSFAPLAGAWIVQAGLDWRWTEWIALILSGSTLILTLLFLPETFSPILLSWRARHLRQLTGCDRFQSELDRQAEFTKRLKTAMLRAVHMITREPIVVMLGAWITLEYLVVFGFLQGFTYIFSDTYGFDKGLTGTCFAALGAGCGFWTLGIPIYYYQYKRKVTELHQSAVGSGNGSLAAKANIPGTDLPQPEYRLWSACLAAPAFPISLFWLGWTNYAFISPWSDLGAVFLVGFSWAGIYVTVYQYLLDTYGIYAGSALAVITCWRYLASGLINMLSRPIYDGIGVHWTMTLFGCLAAIQAPLPIIFYYYGPKIRSNSAFAARYARPVNTRERTGKGIRWT